MHNGKQNDRTFRKSTTMTAFGMDKIILKIAPDRRELYDDYKYMKSWHAVNLFSDDHLQPHIEMIKDATTLSSLAMHNHGSRTLANSQSCGLKVVLQPAAFVVVETSKHILMLAGRT